MNNVDLNTCLMADNIIEIFENQGFTSDTPPDIELLRNEIIEAIQKLKTVSTEETETFNNGGME